MRRAWSGLAGVAAGVTLSAWAGLSAASSGIDSPESGVVQAGRGSAWLARADDPMAVYFNPAALAWQATGVHIGAQLMMNNKCFTRLGPDGKPVTAGPSVPAPLAPGAAQPGDGSVLPSDEVCTGAKPFPNPQLAATFRIADRWAIGLALVAPHAAGGSTFGTCGKTVGMVTPGQAAPSCTDGESIRYQNAFGFASTMPSPQRYQLVSSDALIVFPTIAAAWAPLDNLSFGAGFVWGIGTAHFVTFSEALSPQPAMGVTPSDDATRDVRADLKAKDFFIPGFVLSAMWMPTNNLDIAVWYKWSDALKASADLNLQALYFQKNGLVNKPCDTTMGAKADCNVTDAAGAGTIKFNIPMEAKLGLRFHMPRANVEKQPGWANVPTRKIRDPISQDIFDVEVDFTWANNSSVQDIELAFRSKPPIVINDGSAAGIGHVPINGNIAHKWKDVVGVRLGADFVAVPNLLSLRAGGFYEIKGQDDAYLNLDFDLAQKIGVSGGATLRAGPVDISVMYGHTFFGTIDNGGKGSIYGLSGDASGLSGTNPVCKSTDEAKAVVGPGCFRSWQPVNGGRLTSVLNEVGLAATARF